VSEKNCNHTCVCVHCWPALTALCVARQRQSVRRTSRGLILKTKQDWIWPIVTVVHNIEVDIADFVAALTCSHRLPGKMLLFQIKMCSYINTTSCWTLLLSTECYRPSAVINSHRPLCWQHLWYDAKVILEADQDQLFIAVTFTSKAKYTYINQFIRLFYELRMTHRRLIYGSCSNDQCLWQ